MESTEPAPPWIDPFLMDMDLSSSNSGSIPSNTVQGDNLSYEELLSTHNTLKTSHQNLLLEKVEMQAKIDYWTRIYTYVEKGVAIKIAQMTTVKRENKELKAQNSVLSQRIEEGVNSAETQLATKRIQQLEDQVRARDLVIDLMKKAEREKMEKEMQEKLELQRQEMEKQLGLSIGATTTSSNQTSSLSVWTVPQETTVAQTRQPLVNLRPKPGGVNSPAKSATRSQTRRAAGGTKRKQAKKKDSITDNRKTQIANERLNTENTAEQIAREAINGGGEEANSTTTVEGEMETEFDKALEELFVSEGED